MHLLMGLTKESGDRSRGGASRLFAPSEAGLLRRVAVGDREAFVALYENYHPRLFRYFIKMLRNEGRAEELAQEVLWEVWKGAKGFQGRSSPSTWIFGIAHHKGVNELRRKKEEVVEPDALLHVADPHRGPAEAVEASDLARLMKEALAKLSDEHREVLELTYYQGLSIREIAEILDCPVNTVKTRMFYARQKLKAVLLAMGVTGGSS